MKVAVLGGGPAGLYFAICMKLHDAAHDVTVIERNRPDDTFGWGVVLSAETLDNLTRNDPVSAQWIRRHFAYWDDVAVIKDGVKTVSTGHGFCGIGRKRLLQLLQQRARELGVRLQFETEAAEPQTYMDTHDVVIGADGLNSKCRAGFADVFKPDIDMRKCKFVWLGTHQKFADAFTFIFEKTEHGWVWAHAYQFDRDTATFIVECSQETWDAFGFGTMSKEESIEACETDLRKTSRRLQPDVERQPHARLGLDQFSARAVRALVAQEPGADGRRRGKRPLLHRLGLEARAGKRGGAGRLFAQRADAGGGVPEIRGRAAHRGAETAVGSAQLARMVRGCRALSRPRSGPVQLFAADPLAAHQPRESAPARSRLAGRRGGMVPEQRRRHQHAPRADVRAVPAARHASGEPHRRLADGAVQGRRRLRRPTGISSITPSAPRAAPARLYRDDLRLAGRAHHARLPRLLCARARGAWKRLVDFVHAETDAKICARSAIPARRARPGRLGRHRRAADSRQLAGDGGVGRAWSPANQTPRR
jgi:hypothetical protein